MAGPYNIVTAVQGQPASASLFGLAVKSAINDLDARVAALEGHAPGLVAIHTRTTPSGVTSGGTELGVTRLDNIPVFAGYSYEVVLNRVAMTPSTVTGSPVGFAHIRVAQGATATIASTPIGYFRKSQTVSASNTDTGLMTGVFVATADSTISVLVSIQCVQTTTVTFSLHASTTEASTIYVKLLGPTVADYGTGADIV